MQKSLIVLFALFLSHGVMAQDEYIIYGTVKDADSFKKLGDVEITVLQNGNEFDNIVIGNNGKFEFNLPLGHDYTVIFDKNGYVSKRLFMETSTVPVEDRVGGFETNTDMHLFEYVEGFNEKILEKPIGKLGFDPVRNSIDWDFAYTESVKAEVEAEFDRLANMADEEARKLEEFEKAMREGDSAMAKEDFQEAVDKYSFALAIIPDKEPAPAKLAEAQAALDALNSAEELEREYQRLIEEGERNMSSELWEKAKENYNDALKLKPDERLPKDKLQEIDEILANLNKRAQYDELIAAANKNFESEDYAVSIENYEEALKVLPMEDYPREQIKKAQDLLDAMLDEERRKAELERKYKEFIDLADRNFKDEKYQEAKIPYQQALDLKPEEAYPKDQIAEIERILEELARQQEENLAKAEADALEAEYRKYLDMANEFFSDEQLEDAKENYILALEVKPDERYPQNKIEEIDRLIEEREKARSEAEKEAEENAELAMLNRQYQDLIDSANEQFDADNLEAAREVYVAASELKPSERYPKSRIQRIDEMLEEREREAELAAENEKLKEEEERLAAEKERLAEEKLKEEERLAQLQAEKEEEARLAEERKRQEETEDEKNRNLLNNVDSSREDDVERYYREARLSEEKANYNKRVKEKKEAMADLREQKADESRSRRLENVDEADDKKENMAVIAKKGQALQEKNNRGKEKEKEEWQSKDVEWSENFGYRRLASMEKANEQKQALENLSEKDKYREVKVDEIEIRKEEVFANQRSYEKQGRALAADQEYRVKQEKEAVEEISTSGNDLQLDKANRAEERKEEVSNYNQDLVLASEERRIVNKDKVADRKERLESVSDGKEILSEQKATEVELKKESQQLMMESKAKESEIKRNNKRSELFDKDSGSEKTPDDYNLPEGAEDLKEGVNETSYEMEKPRKTVIERTVKIGNKVTVYRKIISKTGTYYFKGNQSITEATWIRETVKITD